MAGIGFRLQKLLNSKDYLRLGAAYGYSAVVASGPWMMSMLSLVVIGLLLSAERIAPGAVGDLALFRATVTYVYAGSLLTGGVMHLGVSRFIADRLYAGEMEEVLPCFMRAAAAILGLGLVVSGIWFAVCGLGPAEAVAGVVMFQSLSVIWLSMVFLSAAKGYDFIVWSFFIANALGAGLTVLGRLHLGVAGMFWGYALGQLLLAFLLALRIVREFPSYSPETNRIFTFMRHNGRLALVGLAFNLGVWVDKFLVWCGPFGKRVAGLFYFSESYDVCLFFSYLTIIPAMTLFLIRVETSFYRSYSVYFNAVTCGGDIDAIRAGKERIRESLSLSVSRMIKMQGGLTLCLVLAAPYLAPVLGIGSIDVPLLRFSLLAAFLQALLLFLLVFLLYFDWQREALILSVFFALANFILTAATMAAGREYLGLGYLFAGLLSLPVGLRLFGLGMERLEFETFVKQTGV